MKHRQIPALFLCLALLLTACGSSAPTENAGADALYRADSELAVAETVTAEELKTDSAMAELPAQTDRKLIKTVELKAETEHYDELIATLDKTISDLGGYTEARQTGKNGRSSRWSTMTIRIPAEKLGSFLTQVEESANVLSVSEQSQDVTLQYSDTEAKIATLETEQARLLELLAGAQNLSEILEIEARLSDVTYELERYESRKRSYDNQVSFSTVYLTLNEVQTLTPIEEPSVVERITTGFSDSLQGVGDGLVDTFVWLIASSPYLAVYGGALALGLFLSRKLRRKKKETGLSADGETP